MAPTLLLFTSVIFLGSVFSTVNAIQCHQCNSYLNPGCADLDLKAGGPQSKTYLKDCSMVGDSHATFCRKLDVTFLASEERRIIRSCGYILPNRKNVDYCFNADNEGYTEEVCQCYQDNCNAASKTLTSLAALVVALIGYFCLVH